MWCLFAYHFNFVLFKINIRLNSVTAGNYNRKCLLIRERFGDEKFETGVAQNK